MRSNKHRAAGALWILAALAAPTLLAQNIHQVPATFPTIQAAFNQSVNGDIIQVAPGVYLETLILVNRQVVIISTGGPAVTTIDAQGMGTTVHLGNGVSLDGFTITGGVGQGTFGVPLRGRPGGVLIDQNTFTVKPNLRRCIVTGNIGAAGTDATGSGAGTNGGAGGIDSAASSSLFIDCTITFNMGGTGGRGIAPAFHGIGGPGGVAAFNTTHFERCRIAENFGGDTHSSATTSGLGGPGGIGANTTTSFSPFSTCRVLLSEVTGNCGGSGRGVQGVGGTGGIYVFGNVILLDSLVALNQGGVGDPSLIGMSRGGHGGVAVDGPYLASLSSVPTAFLELLQSTVADNSVGSGGLEFAIGGVAARAGGTIQSSILHGNVGSSPSLNELYTLPPNGTGSPIVTISSSVGGADPHFVARTLGDYRLDASSPEIDAGTPLGFSSVTAHLSAVDLRCFSRAVGPAVDRGAFEWHPVESPQLVGSCERIVLRSTTSSVADAGLPVKDVFAGETVNVQVLDPVGTYANLPVTHFLLAEVFVSGSPPASHPLFPELHCDAGAVVLAGGTFPSSGLGINVAGVLPVGLGGTSLRLQAVIPDPVRSFNRAFMITDAHDLILH